MSEVKEMEKDPVIIYVIRAVGSLFREGRHNNQITRNEY